MRKLLTSELNSIAGGLRLDSGPRSTMQPDVYCPYCGQGGTGYPTDDNAWYDIGPSSFNDGYWVPPSPVPDMITIPTPDGDSVSVVPAIVAGEPGVEAQVTGPDLNVTGGVSLGGEEGSFDYTFGDSGWSLSGNITLGGSNVTSANLTLSYGFGP